MNISISCPLFVHIGQLYYKPVDRFREDCLKNFLSEEIASAKLIAYYSLIIFRNKSNNKNG